MSVARQRWLPLLTVALLAGGCGDVVIRRTSGPDLLDAWKSSAIKGNGLSPRTQQTLRRLDLDHLYDKQPEEAAARLHAEAVKNSQPDLLFALAEIHYVRARYAEKQSTGDSLCLYYFAAGYAYHYLFATAQPQASEQELIQVTGKPQADLVPAKRRHPYSRRLAPADAFDPRFRLACDLYNTSLAKCVAAAQQIGRLDSGKELHMPTPDGSSFTLTVSHTGFSWKPEEFGSLQLCDDYEVLGLANQYRHYGLGVPLIATHSSAGRSKYYPSAASIPVTAFFRYEGTVADLGRQRAGRLELYNPLTVQEIQVRGRSIPLESDLTTPLAYFLAHTDLQQVAYTGFLDGDKVENRAGIQLLEPYQPGKIPVLLVHGLLSSPATWTPLYNDLRADPVLRQRCQFWAYFYPTGNPFLLAAADLRADLDKLRSDLDPKHEDAAFDQMVLVGHSMGGLVSRLLTIDSGNDFWQLVSPKPFDQLRLNDTTRAELGRIFFFEHRPCVRRVVFLATPHHGSRLSPALPGVLANQFVKLPKALLGAARDVVEMNPDLPDKFKAAQIPTSVELLAPDSAPLKLMTARPKPDGMKYHSIIGVAPSSQTRLERLLSGFKEHAAGDGVVSYESAHLDGVDSEIVVPADHLHVHHHPLAVQEVRRILLEHCAAWSAK